MTYTAEVYQPEADAEVLAHASRRLFDESHEEFKAAHKKWLKSLEALTTDEHLRCFGEALKKERSALRKQREAILLQRKAHALRAKRWEKLKAERAATPSRS